MLLDVVGKPSSVIAFGGFLLIAKAKNAYHQQSCWFNQAKAHNKKPQPY